MKKNIEEITEQLEQGVKEVFESDGYKAYLDFMAKFYNYSVNNTILIWMQKPDATLVAGYKAWQTKFNRQVRKGEKGITILAPIPHKFKKEVEDENGNKTEKEIQYMTFRAIKVFDISQTDGDEIPSLVTKLDGAVANFDELLNKLKAVSPVPIGFEDITGGANGYYSPADERIAIKNGLSEQHTIKTVIHEISHAMLHGKEGEQADATRGAAEVQAESVAYTVCSWLGLDASDYSFGYVAGWSNGKEAKELTASMEVIRRTAKQIIEGLLDAA